MSAVTIGRDLFVKVTDKHGKSHIAHHRVWDDGAKLFARLKQNYGTEGGTVERSSEEEYRKTQWRK